MTLARFWRYFIAAVDRLRPGAGDAALMLLRSPQAPPIETVLATLLNELADFDTDAVLVLDDYHLIESRTIHEVLVSSSSTSRHGFTWSFPRGRTRPCRLLV